MAAENWYTMTPSGNMQAPPLATQALENDNAADDPQVSVKPTDPCDDEIPLAEYQELFFGDHVVDGDDGNSDNEC